MFSSLTVVLMLGVTTHGRNVVIMTLKMKKSVGEMDHWSTWRGLEFGVERRYFMRMRKGG